MGILYFNILISYAFILFLSGYLASSKREVKLSLVKLFQRLILPFTFFFLISYLFWLPLNIFSDGQASKMEWFDPLNRLVTSKADSFHINGVLWFFLFNHYFISTDYIFFCIEANI